MITFQWYPKYNMQQILFEPLPGVLLVFDYPCSPFFRSADYCLGEQIRERNKTRTGQVHEVRRVLVVAGSGSDL